MSRGLIFGIVLLGGAFSGLNWMLTRPTPPEAPKAETIRQMAKFVEKNPGQFKPTVAGISIEARREERTSSIFGVALDQRSRENLWSASGQEKLLSSVGQNTSVALQDVNQAWHSTDLNDIKQRETLLEVTNTLAASASDASAKDMLLNEAQQYLSETEHQNPDYGGRALQYYLNHESNPEEMQKNLTQMGIPIIYVNPARAPASN